MMCVFSLGILEAPGRNRKAKAKGESERLDKIQIGFHNRCDFYFILLPKCSIISGRFVPSKLSGHHQPAC